MSRDGRSIVYVTWDDQELGSVRMVSADGGEGRSLTTERGHYVEPAFSPDGAQVVFRKISGSSLTNPAWSKLPGLYRVPVGGGVAPKPFAYTRFCGQGLPVVALNGNEWSSPLLVRIVAPSTASHCVRKRVPDSAGDCV